MCSCPTRHPRVRAPRHASSDSRCDRLLIAWRRLGSVICDASSRRDRRQRGARRDVGVVDFAQLPRNEIPSYPAFVSTIPREATTGGEDLRTGSSSHFPLPSRAEKRPESRRCRRKIVNRLFSSKPSSNKTRIYLVFQLNEPLKWTNTYIFFRRTCANPQSIVMIMPHDTSVSFLFNRFPRIENPSRRALEM